MVKRIKHIMAVTLGLQIKLNQLTSLPIFDQKQTLHPWLSLWMVIGGRIPRGKSVASETNRDRSARGSELPHYCTDAFCKPALMTNPPQCVRQIRFLLDVDNKSVVICRRQIQRDNFCSRAWFVIWMVSTCQWAVCGSVVSKWRRRHQLWIHRKEVIIPNSLINIW